MKSKANDVKSKIQESAYSAAGAAPGFPLLVNRPAKNCCTILERAKTDRKHVWCGALSTASNNESFTGISQWTHVWIYYPNQSFLFFLTFSHNLLALQWWLQSGKITLQNCGTDVSGYYAHTHTLLLQVFAQAWATSVVRNWGATPALRPQRLATLERDCSQIPAHCPLDRTQRRADATAEQSAPWIPAAITWRGTREVKVSNEALKTGDCAC